MKILIIQQKMIGDVLTSSILFEALRLKYPKAELHYLINEHTYPVVQNNPFIDHFVFFTPDIENSKLKFLKFLKTIKSENYDAVVDAYGKLNSILIMLFSNARIKIAYFKPYTSFLYSHRIRRLISPVNNSSLAIENRFKLLEPLSVEFKTISPKIYLEKKEIENAKKYLKESDIDFDKPLLMISVLGSNTKKTYPLHYMSTLLDSIIETAPNSQLLFNYIPKQKKEAKQIYENCNERTKQNIFFNVFGKNLREFLSITHHCNALIGNEGGAVNMAKALGINTFTIFSPYLNKQNWFGENENGKNLAVHLSDYISYSEINIKDIKKHPESYYIKFKPGFIIPSLKKFIDAL